MKMWMTYQAFPSIGTGRKIKLKKRPSNHSIGPNRLQQRKKNLTSPAAMAAPQAMEVPPPHPQRKIDT